MQGRCTKLWFLNIRYANDTISHKNTQFDFCVLNEETNLKTEAAHGLITLENGDGKGLILQLFTNLFDPLVDWKDGKNKMEHLFYNIKRKPIKYTGYVIGEFDVGDDRRLMLGMAISPRIVSREQQREERSDLVVDYIQFAREYTLDDEFDIFELPLYDEEKEEALSFTEFKKMVDEYYKDEIEIITTSNRGAYAQLLHSYGYTVPAISNMKKINYKEGSVDTYFSNALTNEGLFFNKIIPAINDELQNSDSTKEASDLLTAFLDTVKIAKDLPVMMRISESAEIIKELLGPVKIKLQQGVVLEEGMSLQRQKGYAIREKLNDVKRSKQREEEIVMNQIEKENGNLLETEYDLANVKYCETMSGKIEFEKKCNSLTDEIKHDEQQLDQLNENLKTEIVHRHLKHLDNYQSSIDAKLDLQKELEESLERKDLVSELKTLRSDIQKRWETHIFPGWKETLENGELFIKQGESEIAIKEEERSGLETRKGEFSQLKKALKTSIDNHKVKLDTVISKRHGESVRYELKEVIKRTERAIQDKVSEGERLSTELVHNEKQYNETSSKSEVIKDRISRAEQEITSLQRKFEEAKDIELMFEDELSNYLKENDGEKRIRSWFLEKKAKIQAKIKKYQEHLAQKERKLWGTEEDQDLLLESEDFDVWVPNKDVVAFRDKIKEQGLNCMLGSELLSVLSAEERKKEMDRNSLIPYSIVLMKEDCARLDFSLLQDHLSRSMVPILVRQEMKKESQVESFSKEAIKITSSGYVVKGQGYEFIEDENAWEYWKNELENSVEELKNETFEINRIIDDGNWLLDRLNHHLAGKISEELIEEIKNVETSIAELNTELGSNMDVLSGLEKKLKELNSLIADNSDALTKEKENLKDILVWNDECEVNEKNIQDLASLEEKIQRLFSELDKIRNDIKEVTGHYKTFQNQLRKWELEAKGVLKKIQSPVVGATFPQLILGDVEEFDSILKPDLSYILDSKSELLLEKYVELTAKEGSSNIRIEVLKAEITNLTNSKDLHLNWLNQNVEHWEEIPVPDETIPEIEEKEVQFNRKIRIADGDLNEKKRELVKWETNLSNSLEKVKRQRNVVLEVYKKEPKYISGLDYEIESANLNRKVEEIKSHLSNLSDEQIKVADLIKLIQWQMENVLFDHLVEVSPFVLSEDEIHLAESEPNKLVSVWSSTNSKLEDDLRKYKLELDKIHTQLELEVERKETITQDLKEPLKAVIIQIKGSEFKRAISSIDGVVFWAEKEVEKRSESKKQCDEAIRFYSERCTKRVQDTSTGVKVLVNTMKVKNVDGEFVELVRFEKNYKFPTDKGEIQAQIKEYVENTISLLIKKKSGNADDITLKDVEPLVNISQLMKVVLGRFPKLYIYIPDGSGSLLTEKTKEHLYKEWEVINYGGKDSPSKSGGQTLMAHMILISMLQKKANDDSWTMIVTDNLFGAMSAKKLMQPLFAALEMLKVQWITVVAASNAPSQVTSNFNTVYLLEVNYQKGKGVIAYDIEHNERKYLKRIRTIEEMRSNKTSESV